MSDAGPEAGGQSGEGPKPGGEGSGGSPKPGGEGSGAHYSQEQVDAFVAEARRRESSRFGDYDQIKTRLAEIEAQGQTELERAQKQAQDADSRATDAIAQRNKLLVRAAVVSAAARAGALDPDVVVALLAESVPIDEAGEIAGDVSKMVADLLEDKPYLKNGTPGVGSVDQGAHSPRQTPSSTPTQRMDDLFRH